MVAARTITNEHQVHWRDNVSWQDQIDLAISTPDPVLANLRITAAHHELSLALRRILGPEAGANFHTWATWGSKKAGMTIRQDDIPHLRALAALLGGDPDLRAMGAMRGRAAGPRTPVRTACMLLGGSLLQRVVQEHRDHASRMILAGNITVLDDIGRQTARFVSAFQGHPEPDARRLADALGALRPGPAESGGQDLLKEAFTQYYLARHAANRADMHEHMLLANLYAILHEHIRLQPYIAGAMPRPVRRLITRHLLAFSLGRRTMSVGRDVSPLDGDGRPGPVAHADLAAFLRVWDRTGGSLHGSRAGNWADIHDRMNFICALFRTGQCDEGLFTAPYTDAQWTEIDAGRIPAGAL